MQHLKFFLPRYWNVLSFALVLELLLEKLLVTKKSLALPFSLIKVIPLKILFASGRPLFDQQLLLKLLLVKQNSLELPFKLMKSNSPFLGEFPSFYPLCAFTSTNVIVT